MTLLLAFACRGDADPADTALPPATDGDPEVHAALVDAVILGDADAFVAGADAMAASVADLCAAPSAATLAAAQAGWRAARVPWKQLEVVNFGPATEEPYRIAPKLDFWPGRPDAVEAYVASDAGLSPADTDAMGGATRGLPALEILLFRATDAGVSPLDALTADPRRCAYAEALALDAGALGRRYADAWRLDWRQRLVDPASADDDSYDRHQDVLDEWVNRMAFTIEDLRYERLGKPMGDSSGGEPLPDTLESRYSGASLDDVDAILAGVEQVFTGGAGGVGVAALLPPDSPIPAAFVQRVGLARDALQVVPEPLERAIVDGRPQVAAAQDALRELQVVIQVDLAQALSVTVVFNDNDGD